MPEVKPSLQLELLELLLVGVGAVPGALLRWQLALHLGDQNLLVNVIGAALLGFLAGLPAAPRRQLLLGIGFCGSLTTFKRSQAPGMAPSPTKTASDAEPATALLSGQGLHVQPVLAIRGRPTPQQPQ